MESVSFDLSTEATSWISRFRSELELAGALFEQSGSFDSEELSLSVHSGFGGKRTNQDAALLWVPASPKRIKWAVAIADGVSQSFHSAIGSRLACYGSLRALARCERQGDGRAFRPLLPCIKLFRALGKRLSRESDSLRPKEYSPSNWGRLVRDGRLLQTTLMVAWQIGTRLYIDGIGDGGFVLTHDAYSPPMVFVPAWDGPVSCLGVSTPLNDRDYGHDLTTWNRLCMFTDGANAAIRERTDVAVRLLERGVRRRQRNPASQLIRSIERWVPELVNDNLTCCCVAKREGQ